jgi:hypothetical protein
LRIPDNKPVSSDAEASPEIPNAQTAVSRLVKTGPSLALVEAIDYLGIDLELTMRLAFVVSKPLSNPIGADPSGPSDLIDHGNQRASNRP